MPPWTLATGAVILAWWLSTALVLRLVWQPPSSHRAILGGAGVLAVAAFAGVALVRSVESPLAAYASFGFALAIWAFHELAFLLGVVTGPRKVASTPGARGWTRFRDAAATLIHHELALAATVGVLVAITWDAPNGVGTSTFVALWALRLSAKLNVFLGVRNITEEFVPAQLRHLTSYFRRARWNPLMPFSLGLAGAAAASLAIDAVAPGASSFVTVSHALVATLIALGALEHVFLAVPLPDSLLWRWALPAKLEDGA